MKFALVVLLSFAITTFALNPFRHSDSPGSRMHHTAGNTSGDCTKCLCITGRLAFSSHHILPRRSHKSDPSISPPSLAPSSNTATINATQPASSQSQLPSWSPAVDTLVTAVFRAVITVLTLFNVNITWRLHGKSYHFHSSRSCGSDSSQ